MKLTIHNSWKKVLNDEFNKPYFQDLVNFISEEYENSTCYPKQEHVFEAFNKATFDKVKVVIIGQDPYHGEGQANGLCFSVNNGIANPPSLKNIFKELDADLGETYNTENGDLEKWANQGVLLLNAVLTVRGGDAGSHQNKGWESFTDAVIKILSEEKDNLVFLLWGGYAKKKGRKIDTAKHLILTSGHPSPLSANRGFWFGNKHFTQTNNYLIKKGRSPINW
ncbi:uracil-DNA glycosylase [Gillisia sp. Hel_I_86]|uniref:uracil-DNA glycosylase n=1 Tax=Gillisia sp. Hel_I_86 TaxID=1249981 RepID=UPI00119C5971|nr:uracil-DNA glycosylase [Gillisia sp. Hel_I_86]TVZ28261.1 uracil-DNA glycosylase [Gillisia sp. Hel_I_86]